MTEVCFVYWNLLQHLYAVRQKKLHPTVFTITLSNHYTELPTSPAGFLHYLVKCKICRSIHYSSNKSFKNRDNLTIMDKSITANVQCFM